MPEFLSAALFSSLTIPDTFKRWEGFGQHGPAITTLDRGDGDAHRAGASAVFCCSSGETNLPVIIQSDSLVLRKQPDSRTLAAAQPPACFSQSATPAEPRPIIVTPSEQPASPPELPKSYPTGGQPPARGWGSSMSEMLPGYSEASLPTHKIIDGDSLALLAERYLGSASRASEIFAANRNVPSQPEILPIGVELKIPRADLVPAQGIPQKP